MNEIWFIQKLIYRAQILTQKLPFEQVAQGNRFFPDDKLVPIIGQHIQEASQSVLGPRQSVATDPFPTPKAF
ncbi:MAG: hypothetical protein ABSE16_06640 [Verrucomicrobiota bacterium]|jgi:hypothetical protein